MICWDSELRYRNSRNPFFLPKFHLTKMHQPPTKETFFPQKFLENTKRKQVAKFSPFLENLLLLRWFQTIFTRRWTAFRSLLEIGFSQSSLQLIPGNSPGGPRSFARKGRNKHFIQRVLIETGDVYIIYSFFFAGKSCNMCRTCEFLRFGCLWKWSTFIFKTQRIEKQEMIKKKSQKYHSNQEPQLSHPLWYSCLFFWHNPPPKN